MTTSVATVISRASTVLQDAGNDRWTTTELVDWITEGELELIKLHPDAKTETRSVLLASGAKQALPADCVSVISVDYNSTGEAVTPCDRKTLDAFYAGWQVKPTGSVVQHWMPSEDPKVFYVYPPQNTTPATVISVFAVYPAVATLTGNLDVRDVYVTNIVNYVLYRAFSKDAEFSGDAQRAVAYYQAFAS